MNRRRKSIVKAPRLGVTMFPVRFPRQVRPKGPKAAGPIPAQRGMPKTGQNDRGDAVFGVSSIVSDLFPQSFLGGGAQPRGISTTSAILVRHISIWFEISSTSFSVMSALFSCSSFAYRLALTSPLMRPARERR